jgi:hypothetical protein
MQTDKGQNYVQVILSNLFCARGFVGAGVVDLGR